MLGMRASPGMKKQKMHYSKIANRSLLWPWLWICLLAGGLTACKSETSSNLGPDQTVNTQKSPPDTTVEGKIRSLTESIKFSPDNYDLYYDRSVAWYEAGNSVRAMDDMDKSIELNITNPEAYYMRGFYYYVQNKDEEALKDFKRAINVGTENPENFYLIGQIHFFRKEFSLAESAYLEAVRLDTMQPVYLFALGYMAEEKGKVSEAFEYYESSLQRNPYFIKSLSALHDISLNERKNPDLAYVYNGRIMTIDSTHPVARFNQGNFFFQRASVITEESQLPEFQVLMKLAVSEYSICLQRDPNFVDAYYNRGYSYYLMQQYNRAMKDFSTVISLDPYNDRAFFMKASIQEFNGDDRGALENYRQAIRINPDFIDASNAVKDLSGKLEAAQPSKPETSGG